MIQKSWRHTQQLTVSCRYHNHRAHFNSMLCSDTLLQSSNIRGETNAISGAESNGVREKAGGKTRKWRPNEREKEGVRPRQDEESLGWLLCCLCLLENKACHCAPCACSIQTEAEIEELGCFVLRGGGKVTECAHWKGTMSALISLWHDKTIRGGRLTKLDYSAPVLRPIRRVISWDSSTQGIAQHCGVFNHCATAGD